MSKKKGETIIWGILIILLGILFLSRNLGWTNLNIWDIATTYWPLILIFIGGRNIVVYMMQKK
ncbi:MAG: hypothetical protein KAS97_07430 [Candidatus Aminicenantes bacterium]|nr:hypothetical protein [Candidatus Aminicenantes bacterium]